MTSPDFTWIDFYKATRDSAHWPLMERGASLVGHPGRALDLGCGAGRDTRWLLSHGWQVTAVDAQPEAIALLAGLPQGKLRAVCSTFEDFRYEPESYDLVSSQFSLPFPPRAAFYDVFARVKQAIKPGGVFAGQFFGTHDEWNVPGSNMTFLTREEVSELLSDLDVIEITEEDEMGTTATGGMKHWHVFHVLARKPAP